MKTAMHAMGTTVFRGRRIIIDPRRAEFFRFRGILRIRFYPVISDVIGHVIDDAISDALIVCLRIIEIVDVCIDLRHLTAIV